MPPKLLILVLPEADVLKNVQMAISPIALNETMSIYGKNQKIIIGGYFMLNSNISWTTHTLNFWRGCTKVSLGCLNCYMFAEQIRYGLDPTIVIRTTKATWGQVKKFCAGDRVFVCSWSDFFHVDADPWRDNAWEVIRSRLTLSGLYPPNVLRI